MDRTRRLAGVIALAVVGAVLAACEEGAGGVVVGSNQPPDPQFTVTPASPSINDEATFDASGSTDPDGSIVEYRWDFDGDTIYETSGVDTVVTHSYATAGDREVVLQLLDNAGDTASVARTITVIDNLPPSAAFSFSPASPAASETVTFDASASDDADGTVVEYRWDFDDDGTFDVSQASPTTTHAFATAGDHIVTLQVVDDDGATGESSRTVAVGG